MRRTTSAAKPTHLSAEDFGDAIFADPAKGFDTVGVVDDSTCASGSGPHHPECRPPGLGKNTAWRTAELRAPGRVGILRPIWLFRGTHPGSAAPGTWPAFWMMPSDNLIEPQPVVAEIDAVELYGHEPTGACHSTHEYRGGPTGRGRAVWTTLRHERSALSWHTYGVSVTPTAVTFYIDGRVVATAPQVDGGGAPMFFLVNLALGGGWPVDLQAVQERAVLYVDYVRVYV